LPAPLTGARATLYPALEAVQTVKGGQDSQPDEAVALRLHQPASRAAAAASRRIHPFKHVRLCQVKLRLLPAPAAFAAARAAAGQRGPCRALRRPRRLAGRLRASAGRFRVRCRRNPDLGQRLFQLLLARLQVREALLHDCLLQGGRRCRGRRWSGLGRAAARLLLHLRCIWLLLLLLLLLVTLYCRCHSA
jgi:hypothetical protein